MSSKSQLDLMSMFQQNQDSVLNGINKFVKDIFNGNNNETKKKLCENLHEITKICYCSSELTENKTSISRKRPEISENELQVAKKMKLDCRKLPNELWLKIMNYLNTKDLTNNLALVCKNFNCLSKEVKYFELKDITDLKFISAINVLKSKKHLKEISVSTLIRETKFMNQLLFQALKSNENIKSIKLLSNGYNGPFDIYSLYSFKRIKTYCTDLEHLYLRDVIFTSRSVISEIAQITTLKSFKISLSSDSRGKEYFTSKNILEFSNNCPKLEAISFSITIGNNRIKNQMKHAFDSFFNAKKETLKSLDIYMFHKSMGVQENYLLENLNLCQNVEELSLRDFELKYSTLIEIINLPKLKTLVLNGKTLTSIKFPEDCFRGYTLMNLKYLKLGCRDGNENLPSFISAFTKINFPVLERFGLEISTPGSNNISIDANAMFHLINNSPKLKSMQLYGKHFHTNIFRKMIPYFCRERNIFTSFGTFTHAISSNLFKEYLMAQHSLEFNMAAKEPVTKIKYDDLKRKFLTWEKMNNWWTWAIENT